MKPGYRLIANFNCTKWAIVPIKNGEFYYSFEEGLRYTKMIL